MTQEVESFGAERRSSVRHTAVTQVAKIRLAGDREELCLLRDISSGGIRAHAYVRLAVGTPLIVELRTAHSASGRVAWAVDDLIGVSFDEQIPTAALLAHCSLDEKAGTLRPPRIKVNMRGLLRIHDRASMVSIGNLSLAGLQIAAPTPLPVGTACTIALTGLPARAASICWWREGHAGLMLTEAFDYASFAAWRSRAIG
jgi:hypothetical protein